MLSFFGYIRYMEKQRFDEEDKVYWNAGWNSHLDHRTGKPVGWMIRGPYDFGFYSVDDGKVVLFEEGERNMQDCFCVSECYVIKESELDERR